MNICVTGGIGSGKSRVCKALADLLSASVISADSVCRDLLAVKGRGWQEVRSFLGSDFFSSDGQIDRPRLRQAIFSDPALRKQLDDALHPLVREELLLAARKAKQQRYVLLTEVPLLFEKGWQSDCDWTVLVFAGEETCVRRIMLRDRVSEEDARLALTAQMPLHEKRRLADSLIDNSSSFTETLQQLNRLSEMIRESSFFHDERIP
ncbi:MAG: dephospho-CoA kinase [Proteobacteria bacterium]|nr:dephospho-CoA kinase [Pseudomonadota bacterium]MBU1420437.1 dephospho-CoA kinase [Pseudomonadota bacterium]MBU1456360.1 dephospho-CoA kinase [Pseudomonadota bacterium]